MKKSLLSVMSMSCFILAYLEICDCWEADMLLWPVPAPVEIPSPVDVE